MKRVPLLIILFAMCLAFSPPASAALQTLTDGNSVLLVNTTGPAGAYSWTVDGIDVLFQQWFWYRVGNEGAEQSIDKLTNTKSVVFDNNILKANYAGDGFSIEIMYTLLGGAAGSHWGDIGEQIKITNSGSTPLDFHFFQYSDFDLNGVGNTQNDTIQIDPKMMDALQQPTAGVLLSETVVTPAPNHAEAGLYPDTLNRLNDLLPTTLNDKPAIVTPGDVTWAFEWDFSIGAGSNVGISKDKRVAAVPEPAAIELLAGVLLVVASKLRKRHA